MGVRLFELLEISLFAGLVFSVSVAYADVVGIANCTCDHKCYVEGTYAYADWKWVWNQTDNVPAGSELYKEKLIYWNDSNVTGNVTISGWYVDGDAMDAEWEGVGYNISVSGNCSLIDTADIVVNSSTVSGLSNYTLWDDRMPLEIAVAYVEGAAQVVDGSWFKVVNVTEVNSTGQEITNVVFVVEPDVKLIEETEYLNVTWNGVEYNITPRSATGTCTGSNPDYEKPLGIEVVLTVVGDQYDAYDFSEKMRCRASETNDEDFVYYDSHSLGGVYGIFRVGVVDYDSVDCTGYSYDANYDSIFTGQTYCVKTKEGDYAKIKIVDHDLNNYVKFYWDTFDVFYVCKQDTDADGMIDYFKVKQPYAGETQYESGGDIFEVYNVTVAMWGDVVAGKPVGVTVTVSDLIGPVGNATVRMTEKNGYDMFAMTQVWSSFGLTSYSVAEVKTNDEGAVNFTIVPTGGIPGQESKIGEYNISLEVLVGGVSKYETGVNWTDRSFLVPNETVFIPNYNNVNYVKDKVYIVYDRVKGWLSNGGGENHDVLVYVNNGTAEGMNFSVVSGKPTGMHVRVMDGGSPVENATVRVTEKNGYSVFAPMQVWSSFGLTSYSVAEVRTDGNGWVNFTVVPTGGLAGQESKIGEYNISFEVLVSGVSRHDVNITCSDRGLPAYSSGVGVPNQNHVDYVKDRVYIVYDKIKRWLA